MRTTLRSVFYAALVSLPQRALPALPVLLPLLPLLLAACSEAADGGSYATADDPLALRSLTVGVADAAETRGASDLTDGTDYMAPTTRTTGDQDTHGNYCCFEDGERFFAVASQGASLQTAVYQCGARQSNTSGEKTYYYNTATAEGQPLVASATGDTKICAFAPYQAGGTTDGATVSVNNLSTSFSVQQTQTSGADLRASDLLYAEATVAAGTTAAVNAGGTWHQDNKLSFQHQLAQLVIRFINSDANSQYPTLQRVRVTSGYRTIALQSASDGTMTLSTAAGALSDALSAASPMTVFDGSQTIDNTEPGVEIGFHPSLGDRYHVCILPPQTLAAGTTLIQAETSVGTISYYLPQAQTLQAGRSYRITLPVAPVAQTGAVAITGWDETTWTYTAQGTATTDTQYHADGALLFNVGGVEFNMIRVKSGTASNADLSGGVTVAEDFYIGETEVTQALWKAAGQTLPTLDANYRGDRKPITNINVTQANTFIAALNTSLASQLPDGYEFALPTLDQWRYAFLGGCYSRGYKFSGSDNLNAVAWHSSALTYGGTTFASNTAAYNHDVAILQPNELGLYDMSGNVCEMVYKDAANTYWMGGSQQHNTAAFYQVNHSNNSPISTANHSWGCRLALVPTALTRNFSYTGSVQTFTARRTGRYKIECWGASGGDAGRAAENTNTSSAYCLGGRGGYSVGYYQLTKGQQLYVYVGQQGQTTTSTSAASAATWNGGGAGSKYGETCINASGGGASDVRTVSAAWDNAGGLAARLIVAGGGGGSTGYGTQWKCKGCATQGHGGYGGGATGGAGVKVWQTHTENTQAGTTLNATYYNNAAAYSPAQGGTASAGGTAYNGTYKGFAGSLGKGGNGQGNWGGGGGGGYYGGGGGGYDAGVVSSGGGGSGYVGGVADGRMIAGNAVMPSTTYGTELGHTGNGYCRITWQSK